MYALTELGKEMSGVSFIKPVEYILGGFSAIFSQLSGFAGDLTVDTEAAPPIIPQGTYRINQYTVAGEVIQQQIGVSSGNNYYKTEYVRWNPERKSYILDTFFGWEEP